MRALVVFALVAGCSATQAFTCEDEADCAGEGGGMCEPSGFCSFPDDDCDSGRRYGQWAGDLAMSCVPTDVASASTGSESDDGETLITLTSSDPTTLTSSATLTTTTGVDTGETTSAVDPETSTSTTPATTDDPATTGEPLDPDLVAWYRFEQDDFSDAVVDEIGVHDGTCDPDRCPQPIEGIVGFAAAFDGIDDIVHVAASDALQVDTAFTIALWVRIDSATAGYHTLAGKAYLDQTNNTWELGLDSRTNIEFGMATLGEYVYVSSPPPAFDTWMHAAGVWDGEFIRLYLDGALIGEVAATDPLQDEHGITLGADSDFEVDDGFFDGALDEVRIYRRALAEDEVAALATAP